MSISLPHGHNVNLPDVPENLRSTNPGVYRYLVDLRRSLTNQLNGLGDNDTIIQTAVNSGASGTFITSGKSFVFVNGIFTSTV